MDGLTGETLESQTVAYGQDAAAPEAPAHEGYTFTGWLALSLFSGTLAVACLVLLRKRNAR